MPNYSLAAAKEQLSQLIDEALRGEPVTIVRDGTAVVELRPTTNPRTGRPTPELLEEIAALARSLPPSGESSAEVIRAMRDERP